jgi:hypothetical protein
MNANRTTRARQEVEVAPCHDVVAGVEEDRVLEIDVAATRLACRNAAGKSGTWTKPKWAVIRQTSSASFSTSRRSVRGTRGTSANLTVNTTTLSCNAPICST